MTHSGIWNKFSQPLSAGELPRQKLSMGKFLAVRGTVLMLLVLTGCAKHVKAPGVINYTVGPECHPSARLLHCDSANPPNCQTAEVKYDKDCEQISAK